MDYQYYSKWESIASHALKRVDELEKEIEKLEQEPSGDLISREAVIDIIHRFFTEEVDKIPTKKTEDGEVLIMCKAQPLFAMNKAICKRIKALPSVSPTQNCVGNALDALDCISRQAVIDLISKFILEIHSEGGRDLNAHTNDVLRQILRNVKSDRVLPPVNPQSKTEQFAEWVAREIFDEMWEYNKDAFAEIACRKLAKLGIVRAKGDEWELVEPQESEDKE